MIIPWQELEDETLINIVQSFILREGTDYGQYEYSFAQKQESLLKQIKANQVLIFYSVEHNSIDLKNKNDF